MSKYRVSVLGHSPLDVEVPERIDFSAPATPDQARAAIAYAVGEAVLPMLRDQPPMKRVTRDAKGQIEGIIEQPAVSREKLAAEVGRAIAREILDITE